MQKLPTRSPEKQACKEPHRQELFLFDWIISNEEPSV